MKKYYPLFVLPLLLSLVSCQNSIKAPVEFHKEKNSREVKVVERLKDIREVEIIYKQLNGSYTDSFDELIRFCKNTEIPVVRLMPDPNDATFTNIISDTVGYVKVMDSLFRHRTDFDIEKFGIVPFSDPETQFELNAGFVERKGLSIPVFEAKTPYEVYLAKPSKKFTEKEWNNRVKNLKDEMEQLNKYAGLKVGSMEEASTDGNWEKL